MHKANYHLLARLVPREMIDSEVVEKLDTIVDVAESARPLREEG